MTLLAPPSIRALVLPVLALAISGAALGQDPAPSTPTPAPGAPKQAEARYEYAMLETSQGNILLQLDRARAPISVRNFMKYVEDGGYDGTIFHRVINGFMIQGGGFTPDMTKKPAMAPIKNEWMNGLKNENGTIAMARTSNPNSATNQFFINVNNNVNLDRPISGGAGYAVFGRVVMGMDVVNRIKSVKTGSVQGYQNVPVQPVVIEKAVEVSPEEAARLMQGDATKDQPGKTPPAGQPAEKGS
ncbi:MAG: peptidylprolyl isomerase [Planctomycetota bacterium]|nr:peptidylprolyl isomerase [Planctomycetota bacterium]MEC9233336.1 peptidylprolyl isomerase [Planctomycetota bacterium]